jgi:diguanylate cyclase
MIVFDWPLVISGCLLATILLLVGMAVGMWMARGATALLLDGRREMHQARLIASRLQQLTSDVSSIVDEHRGQIDDAIQQLATTRHQDNESLAKLVVDVFDNIVNANKSLQSSLTSAEDQLQEQAEEIEAHMSLSMTDPLTGLLNRRGFDEQLEARIAARRRDGEAFSVLVLDVDYFKQINDNYGHLVGDRMLVAVAQALRESLRQADSVARYGGDEFAILLPNSTLEEGVVVAHKLTSKVASTAVEERGFIFSATASSGLAMCAGAEDGKSLLERADAAMYAAKEAGRNRVYMHNGVECCPTPGQEANTGEDSPEFTRVVSEAVIEAELHALAASTPDGDGAGDPEDRPVHEPSQNTTDDGISPQMDDLCDELRRYLADRELQEEPPTRPKQAF